MKKLLFMRHGFLEGKFADYTSLNFNDFEELLLKKATPPLDREKTRKKIYLKEYLSNVEAIICSTESRSIETAQIVSEIFGKSYQQNHLLNELIFMQGVIAQEDIDKHDFGMLRKKILTQFFNSKCTEEFQLACQRFIDFLNYASKQEQKTLLCITHGWFMRLIYIYSKKRSLDNISLSELLEIPAPDFLDIIEIQI